MRKKLITALTCALALLLFCPSVFAVAVSDFVDVPTDSWYIHELTYAVEHNMINGTSDTTFSPGGEMTRAQFITIIGRALNGTAKSTGKFSDVNESQYYIPYLYWGVENGIIFGTSDTTFSPDDHITRQDMATIVGRTIDNMGLKIEPDGVPVESFADYDSVAPYAKDCVNLLREKALLKGDDHGNVNPKNNMTRAEGVAVLSRMMMNISADNATTDPGSNYNPTSEQLNALSRASKYLSIMAFSYDGLVDQLEYENYSHDAAVYAADNCGANWNDQALKRAKKYLDLMALSYSGLVEQLDYDKFTSSQATYAAENCGANWNEQAAKRAASYLEIMSFSRDGLIDQLEYDGFTHDQAVYGAAANGL